MVKTKILISVIIVVLIGVAAAGYQISSDNTQNLWQPTSTQEQQSTDQGSDQSVQSQSGTGTQEGTSSGTGKSESGDSGVKITPSQAKSIVQNNYIQQEGATAGTPKLTTMNGKKAYIVPVIMNGNQVGEIWIDAQTGENIGGAGGAP